MRIMDVRRAVAERSEMHRVAALGLDVMVLEDIIALPVRADHEPVARYLERLARATDAVRRHPPRED